MPKWSKPKPRRPKPTDLVLMNCYGCNATGAVEVMVGPVRQVQGCVVCHGSKYVMPGTNAVFGAVRQAIWNKFRWPLSFIPSNRDEPTAPKWMIIHPDLRKRLRE